MTSPLPVEITTLDGCALRGNLWTGGADWVVLVHDSGPEHDLDRWLPLVPSLTALEVSVCAVDRRGHGASDGEPDTGHSVGDMRTLIRFAKANCANVVIVVAAGDAVWSVLEAVETETIDGVVSISATGVDESGLESMESVPRGPGIPKLFIVGSGDEPARAGTQQLQRAAIGWSLIVSLPTKAHGTELLAGEWLSHIREHIAAFIRERRYVARSKVSGERGSV